MKRETRPNHKKRNILLIVLLAVICIGTTELIACKYFAPDDFQRITAPVRRAARSVGAACERFYLGATAAVSDSLARASLFWQELTTPPEETPDPNADPGVQEAGEPALSQDKPPVTDPLITELRQEDGHDILTGGSVNVVYFQQGSEEWASLPYGTDTIGPYGCGPTAMAMVVASLTDIQTDPAVMARWAVDNGHWASKGGSCLSIVEDAAQAHGLHAESYPWRTPEDLVQTLFSGNILVALMGPGHFTQKGHFIILRGATLSGEILVADPNSCERSLTTWDPQLILDELSASTSDGAPLWVISPPGF